MTGCGPLPGSEFTGHHFGLAREATYRVNEAGTAAVFVEGTEREIKTTYRRN